MPSGNFNPNLIRYYLRVSTDQMFRWEGDPDRSRAIFDMSRITTSTEPAERLEKR
jgi:hypothetical protein